MLEVKTISSDCDARVESGTHSVKYDMENNLLKKVEVTFLERVEEESLTTDGEPVVQEHVMEAGFLVYKDGMISMYNFKYGDRFVEYMSDFEVILSEIKSRIKDMDLE